MHGRLISGGPPALLMRKRYSGALGGSGTGPISATLVPPAVDPPGPPSVKSQALPAASVASEADPSAVFACATVE